MPYDAFISYSHSADGRLAPAVQDGMQRLAKPWNRRRALRVFRDDTGLSANPALWSSIVAALDESRWFLLFLSPAAAQSEWVNREVSHWLATKEATTILPVLTEGELVWDATAGDFDAARSTALPPALIGALVEEPRHLDLRWAHSEDQLDLRNSAFRAAVADLAAPVHGIPKEDLEGEDVRLHRRARRLARTAVVALVVLFLASLGATVAALANASRADEAAADARDEAARAQAAEAVAEEQRTEAEAQRAVAEAQRDLAEENLARALSAEELATYEAERAAEEQARAEEQAEVAEAERVRAVRAPLCDANRTLGQIEEYRLLPAGELYEPVGPDAVPVDDANRQSVLNDLRSQARQLGVDGLGIVAIDALGSFSLGELTPDIVTLADPRAMPPYEWDYAEDPLGDLDYYDGVVSMSYDEAMAELDGTVGALCREVGLG